MASRLASDADANHGIEAGTAQSLNQVIARMLVEAESRNPHPVRSMAGPISAFSQPPPAPHQRAQLPPPQAGVPSHAQISDRLLQLQAQQTQQAQADAALVQAAGGQSQEQVIARLVQIQLQQARQMQEAARQRYQQYSGVQAPLPDQQAQLTREHIQLQNEWMQHVQAQPLQQRPNQPYSAMQMQGQHEGPWHQPAQQQRVQAWLQQQSAPGAPADILRQMTGLSLSQQQHAASTIGHVPQQAPPSAPPGFVPPQPAAAGTNMLHVFFPHLRTQPQAQPQVQPQAQSHVQQLVQQMVQQMAGERAQQHQLNSLADLVQYQQPPGFGSNFGLYDLNNEMTWLLEQQAPSSINAGIARAILIKAAELPMFRRHELVSAAAADPDLALAFTEPADPTQRPTPQVVDMVTRKLAGLLQQVRDSSPPPPNEAHETRQGPEAPDEAAEPLTLKVLPEYEKYALGKEACRAVISIKASAEVKKRAHVALTCVLDRSGSMGGERIELVRETCHFLIDQLTADDYLGIVSYSNTVREDVPLLRMTPEARRLAHAMISSLTLHGGTALYAGLEAGVKQQMAAASELKALAAAAGGGSVSSRIVHSCFLFTDGQATTGPCTVNEIMGQMTSLQSPADQNITVHTFGFGDDHSVELLQGVAEAQSGVYYYISCADDIPSGFGDALGGLLAVVAKDVRVSIRTKPGIKLVAFRSGGRVVGATGAASGARNSAAATTPGAKGHAAPSSQPFGPQAPSSIAAAAAAAAAGKVPAPPRPTAVPTASQPPPTAPVASVFNDMFAAESRECLLVLGLPAVASARPGRPASGAHVLCHVDLEYTDVATGRRIQATATLALPRSAAPRTADAQPAELVFITAARFETLDAIEAAGAAAARPGGTASVAAAQGLLDAHMARLRSTPRWGGPDTPLSQALDTFTVQAQSARASVGPRFAFNADGVAAAASIAQATQALRHQRLGTSTLQPSPEYAALDNPFKSQYRTISSARVTACCPSLPPPPF